MPGILVVNRLALLSAIFEILLMSDVECVAMVKCKISNRTVETKFTEFARRKTVWRGWSKQTNNISKAN